MIATVDLARILVLLLLLLLLLLRMSEMLLALACSIDLRGPRLYSNTIPVIAGCAPPSHRQRERTRELRKLLLHLR